VGRRAGSHSRFPGLRVCRSVRPSAVGLSAATTAAARSDRAPAPRTVGPHGRRLRTRRPGRHQRTGGRQARGSIWGRARRPRASGERPGRSAAATRQPGSPAAGRARPGSARTARPPPRQRNAGPNCCAESGGSLGDS
jgi:hypothetical protein